VVNVVTYMPSAVVVGEVVSEQKGARAWEFQFGERCGGVMHVSESLEGDSENGQRRETDGVCLKMKVWSAGEMGKTVGESEEEEEEEGLGSENVSEMTPNGFSRM